MTFPLNRRTLEVSRSAQKTSRNVFLEPSVRGSQIPNVVLRFVFLGSNNVRVQEQKCRMPKKKKKKMGEWCFSCSSSPLSRPPGSRQADPRLRRRPAPQAGGTLRTLLPRPGQRRCLRLRVRHLRDEDRLPGYQGHRPPRRLGLRWAARAQELRHQEADLRGAAQRLPPGPGRGAVPDQGWRARRLPDPHPHPGQLLQRAAHRRPVPAVRPAPGAQLLPDQREGPGPHAPRLRHHSSLHSLEIFCLYN